MIFIIEAIVLCIIFTLAIIPVCKNPLIGIHDYPPAIIERVKSLGLITDDQIPHSKVVITKKISAALLISILLGFIVYKFNGADNFITGAIISYLLWFIVDWYDALVIDIAWFCHNKKFIIPGTEDMVKDYHDYMFHIKGSVKGMLYGIPVCLLVGLLVQLFVILK